MVRPVPTRDRTAAEGFRIERIDPALVPIYQRMTVPERLAASFAATRLVRARIRAHLGGLHPDWSTAQIETELARRIGHGTG